MTGSEYGSWVAQAQAFVARIGRLPGASLDSDVVAPPAGHNDLALVERALHASLPEPLRVFFAEASAGLDCRYAFEPAGDRLNELRRVLPDAERIYGGPRLGPLAELPEMSSSVSDWARETWIAEDAEQRLMWECALPFLHLDNGDFLALDLRGGRSDPPVVYLNHDDESALLSATFDSFLDAWERLCYIGPEHWLLLEFTGPDGYLDASAERAAGLRRLLTE